MGEQNGRCSSITKVVYAVAFTSFGQECILRLRKPMVRLAFADMLLMWLFQLKSELIIPTTKIS
jgi:hypothetical protein